MYDPARSPGWWAGIGSVSTGGEAGGGTEISVRVQIPDAEAHRLDAQRDVIRRSLARLAGLAAATSQKHQS